MAEVAEAKQKQSKSYPLTSKALAEITASASEKIAAFKKAHGIEPSRPQGTALIRAAWDEYATAKFVENVLEDVGDALGLSAFAD